MLDWFESNQTVDGSSIGRVRTKAVSLPGFLRRFNSDPGYGDPKRFRSSADSSEHSGNGVKVVVKTLELQSYEFCYCTLCGYNTSGENGLLNH